ncbi:MAG TPA: cupin domain-containing protein [Nocardioides sp.]|jgi:mannose-6-phosphate isomerase-like protein (cupin superfamily)|uniref:cupin domain-containing protein n=1 Tax=Nocardioides sp. TaxID=35761 RepID=UPI002E31D6B2|nr:cupin domain-containing protein [Nocardioides sp.]HEX3931822.1 cupin domain-containing protein [Nocardioides sp.]
MSSSPDDPAFGLVLRPSAITAFSRGSGVSTVPFVGHWNSELSTITTGMTVFPPGTAIPLHTHNVEETVLVLRGEATAVLGDQSVDLTAGEATWVAAGVPHRFVNRGAGELAIYWTYAGRFVTRTTVSTGRTVVHLSEEDRGASGS